MIDFLVSISNLIIDDVLTYDGKMFLGQIGGAGPHALAGCRIWEERPLGFIANAGSDFHQFKPTFDTLKIDISGLHYFKEQSSCAWQLFQPGGVRVQIWKYPDIGVKAAYPDFENLDKKFRLARGYHIVWNGDYSELLTLLCEIRENNAEATILYEPTLADIKKREPEYRKIFNEIDVFSPNLLESFEITGLNNVESILEKYLKWGCRHIALRCGEQGSYWRSADGPTIFVPVAESHIVDQTGAGNAYNGGLLYGLAYEYPIEKTLAKAAVSASFEMEQFGLCIFEPDMVPVRDKRYRDVLEHIQVIATR